jgi:hypothetical protein
MDKLNAALTRHKVPFSLWNLFEDARIEHLGRQEFAETFDWLADEKACAFAQPVQASQLLFAYIQHEGQETWVTELPQESDVLECLDKVREYYGRICACPSTMELLPIAVQWLEDFPNSEFAQGDLSLLQSLMQMAPDQREKTLSELDGKSESAQPPRPSSNSSFQAKAAQDYDGTQLIGKSSAMLEPLPNCELEAARVQRAAHKLKSLLQAGGPARKVYSQEPSKRLSSRHLGMGQLMYQHREKQTGAKTLEFTVVFDCSGSMRGFAHDEGVHLVAALNELARQGLVRAQLILSRIVMADARNASQFQVIPLPCTQDVLQRIPCNGMGEGLQYALSANLKSLEDFGNVFIYTDACIGDAKLQSKALARRGIFPVGLYIASEQEELYGQAMQEHFEQFVVRASLDSLVESLAQRRSWLQSA